MYKGCLSGSRTSARHRVAEKAEVGAGGLCVGQLSNFTARDMGVDRYRGRLAKFGRSSVVSE